MINSTHATRAEHCPMCDGDSMCRLFKDETGRLAFVDCYWVNDAPVGSKAAFTDGTPCIATKVKDDSAMGTYVRWNDLAEYEKFREKSGRKKDMPGAAPAKVYTPKAFDSKPKERGLIPGEVEVADHKRLDELERGFLDLLTLEDKHIERFKRDGWDKVINGVNVYDEIMRRYPIRSIPPRDRLRFDSKEFLRSLSQKKIMELMVEKYGEPEGMPLLYEKEKRVWGIYPLCGIAYPTYNTYGEMGPLRIGDDYPVVFGKLNGREGSFSYRREKADGTTGWYFIPFKETEKGVVPDYDFQQLVWRYGSDDNLVGLDKKGYPTGEPFEISGGRTVLNKPSGKYKNSVSFKEEKDKDGSVRNAYNRGCQYGSPLSLYTDRSKDDPAVLWFTEGEKKGMVGNVTTGNPWMTIPGVNAFRKVFEPERGYSKSPIDRALETGTKLFIIAYDADKRDNKMVRNAERQFAQALKERGCRVGIADWSGDFGKGIDDAMLDGLRPMITLIK